MRVYILAYYLLLILLIVPLTALSEVPALQITAPPSGTVVAPGDTVNVTVQVNDPSQYSSILLMPARLEKNSASVVHFSLSLEAELPAGPLPLIAVARPINGGPLVESVLNWHLSVKRPSGSSDIVAIDINTHIVELGYIGDRQGITVLGTLSSGKRITLGGDPNLNFSLSSPIAVVHHGDIQALAPGTAILTISYDNLVEEVSVKVSSNPLKGDLDSDNDVDVEDLDVIKDWNGRATVPNDARDLDSDGDIDAADEVALIALCTRRRCAVDDGLTWGMLPDTIAPTIAVTSPLDGAVVSGIVTLAANAADDDMVKGVTFYVDDVVVGSEILQPPYTFNWNASTVAMGSHKINAKARDDSGNVSTSEVITVKVVRVKKTVTHQIKIK